jgi:hypothetical protein
MGDFRDKRGGAYDPVTSAGNPQPPRYATKRRRIKRPNGVLTFGLSRNRGRT